MSDVTLVVEEEEGLSLTVVESPVTVVPVVQETKIITINQGIDGDDGVGIPAGGTTGQLLAKNSNTDFDSEWIDPPVSTGTAEHLAQFDADGDLASVPTWSISADTGGLLASINLAPAGETGGVNVSNSDLFIAPTVDSPDLTFNQQRVGSFLSGAFGFGSNGQGFYQHAWNIEHTGTADTGGLNFVTQYFNIGNGTDPVDVRGLAYQYGFGNINAFATISAQIQGYGFQIAAHADAVIEQNVTAFYDFANFAGEIQTYTSFVAGVNIARIANNNNYTGLGIGTNINELAGNAGFSGVAIYPTIDAIGTGSFQGVSVNPTIPAAGGNFVAGLNVSMNNVTGTNVFAAWLGGDAYISGDLEVAGDISFGGGLAIGQLSAFYSTGVVDGGGTPLNMHGLTTEIIAPANTTTANCDAIGVNTAMLMRINTNSINTSGPFGLGFAALALPCVVETHTGSSVDYMSGAVFALNLVGSSTGGTIQNANVCRSIVIPNGITTVENARGFYYHEPFGPVATKSWGFFADAGHNYMREGLAIGDTDRLDTSVALQIDSTTLALRVSTMDTTQEGALTPSAGMIICNTQTGKFRGYVGGAWVDLN